MNQQHKESKQKSEIGTNFRAFKQELEWNERNNLHFIVLIWGGSLSGPGRVAQSVGHLTRKSGFLGSIPGLATYFRFSLPFFKKGSCQLLAKVCARSSG